MDDIGPGAYPSNTEIPVQHCALCTHTFKHTIIITIPLTIMIRVTNTSICMFLGCGRKSVNLEETHINTTRTCETSK